MTVICCDDFVRLCDFGAFIKGDQAWVLMMMMLCSFLGMLALLDELQI